MKLTAGTARTFARIPRSYAGLMGMYLLRPLHHQVDAENAAEVIDLLAGYKLNAEQADYWTCSVTSTSGGRVSSFQPRPRAGRSCCVSYSQSVERMAVRWQRCSTSILRWRTGSFAGIAS